MADGGWRTVPVLCRTRESSARGRPAGATFRSRNVCPAACAEISRRSVDGGPRLQFGVEISGCCRPSTLLSRDQEFSGSRSPGIEKMAVPRANVQSPPSRRSIGRRSDGSRPPAIEGDGEPQLPQRPTVDAAVNRCRRQGGDRHDSEQKEGNDVRSAPVHHRRQPCTPPVSTAVTPRNHSERREPRIETVRREVIDGSPGTGRLAAPSGREALKRRGDSSVRTPV